MPDIDNTLFGNASQLTNTSKYYFMAHRRRANAHNQAVLQRNEMICFEKWRVIQTSNIFYLI